jgi:hypothetical protein
MTGKISDSIAGMDNPPYVSPQAEREKRCAREYARALG